MHSFQKGMSMGITRQLDFVFYEVRAIKNITREMMSARLAQRNIKKKIYQVQNHQRHVFLTQSSGHDKNPNKRLGLDPTVKLVGCRSEPEYKKDNRELGTYIEIHMILLAGILQLIKLFWRFRKTTLVFFQDYACNEERIEAHTPL